MNCLLYEKAFLKAAIDMAAVVTTETVKRFGSILSVSSQINSKKNHRQAEDQEVLSIMRVVLRLLKQHFLCHPYQFGRAGFSLNVSASDNGEIMDGAPGLAET